uniref:Deoxyribodipyrimidine photo-lyase n=1 Tax=Actinia tenebrosa TaxID=6105 RepID=A0A1D7XF26_ACTTE|nr:deoxyribodipyrimidine photolyase-like protein [Actinia tenebrosa]
MCSVQVNRPVILALYTEFKRVLHLFNLPNKALYTRKPRSCWKSSVLLRFLSKSYESNPSNAIKTMTEPPNKKAKKEHKLDDSADDDDILRRYHKKRKAVCESVLDFKFNKKRVRLLSKVTEVNDDCKGIVYWMWRDQRVQDNWALLYAQRLALKQQVPLHVCFCLPKTFLDAAIRKYGFMLKGLKHVEKELSELDISFHLCLGEPDIVLPELIKKFNFGGVVCDFCPLRKPMQWVDKLIKALPKSIPVCQVDAHNIVPCWETSPKLEYGARTIRPKIHKVLQSFLTEFPPVIKHPHVPKVKVKETDWKAAYDFIDVDDTVKEVDWAEPGTEAGLKMLEEFCAQRLKHFATSRNDPTKKAISNLSPWFNTGQISNQRTILKIREFRGKYKESVESFIEESVVRRELSENFCYCNDNYDSIDGTNDWAKKTLEDHAGDKREPLYDRETLETAKTYDDLWNAAQRQLVCEGKLHGFLRMYWAKKILEWTKSPEVALADAIYFNDKYALDGIDPNGYVGCMWSICGIHDQGWKERPIFGKIRYMNYKGCQRKFDVAAFVKRYKP